MEQNDTELEPCLRCGYPIPKGDGLCNVCLDELRYDEECEKMELHERYEEAARRGEL